MSRKKIIGSALLVGGIALLGIVRIPVQTGHPIHSKPATHSGVKPATYSSGIRPLIPEQAGHPIKSYSDAG